MRFLSVNHLRLGSAPGGIPAHLASDIRAFSSRSVWQKAISLAVREEVHAVLLSGQTLSHTNTGLEPWGPLLDGLADLEQADIPVIAVEDGQFTTQNLARFSSSDNLHWLHDSLNWEPIFTTTMSSLEAPSVRVINGSLAESADAPVAHPVTLDQLDQPNSIWILTNSLQPDAISGEHTLVIEPGSATPLSGRETGQHGVWIIDTETQEAELLPLANIEFASLDVDIGGAVDLDNLERIITASLVEYTNQARELGSAAHTFVIDITLTGATRLYPALADTAQELESMLSLEHEGTTIGINSIEIDATPLIDLAPLLNRPDPVGEVARLIDALDTGQALSEAQSHLLGATEQKLLSISHARVFGSILDTEPANDAPGLLRRQSWATLDALVRQRGID